MSDSIEFQLKLQDQMTAALRSSADSAVKLDQALQKLTGKLKDVEHSEQGAGHEAGFFKTKLDGVWEYFLEWEIVEKLTDGILELGRAFFETGIEATDFGFKAEVALRHLNGETEEAKGRTTKMLEEAKKFSLDAGLGVHQVTEAFLGLRRAGIDDQWVRPLTAAAGDLAALTGHPEKFNELTEAFARMGEKGEVTSRDLLMLRSAGLNVGVLAQRLGAKDFAELQKQLSKQPLGLYQGLRAIEDVIVSTAHENQLGEVLKEDSQTIGAQLTRIGNVWDILLENLNTSDVFKGLRTDFGQLVDDLISHLPEIENLLVTTFDPVIKAIDDLIKNPAALKDFFEEASGAIKGIAGILEGIIKGVGFLAEHNLLGAGAAAAVGGAVAGPAGAAIAGGTVAYAGARKQEHDEFISRGYSEREANQFVGKFAEGGPVPETGLALVHEGEFVVPPGGARVSGGGGGGSIHAPIQVTVNVAGKGDAQELRLMLEDIMPGLLVSPLEKLAATAGAM